MRNNKGSNNPSWRGGRRKDKRGYVQILKPDHPFRHKHTNYVYEHRLIIEEDIGRYLLPTEVVDHINGDKSDNRLENLRLTNQSVNGLNRHNLNKNNTSGHRGISYDKSRDKWAVMFMKNYRHVHLGRFKTLAEAIKTRDEWLKNA